MQTEQQDPMAKLFEEAFQAIVDATPDPIHVPTLRTSPQVHRQRRRPVIVVAALFLMAAGVLIMNAVIDTSTGGPQPGNDPGPAGPPTVNQDTSSVPTEVQDYWDLEGELYSIVGEEPWLCPPAPLAGFSKALSEARVPADLRFEAPGEVVSESASDYGPLCQQPPLAVLTSSGSDSTSSFVIYPSTAVQACTSLDVTCPGGRGWTAVAIGDSQGEALIDPADGYVGLRWTTPNGYALHALGNDVSLDEAVAVAELVDVGDNRVEFASDVAALGFDVEDFGRGKGEWITDIVNIAVVSSRGLEVQISTRYRPAFSVHGVPAGQVVGENGEAVWVSDGGGFLMAKKNDQILAIVEGAEDPDHALELLNGIDFDLDYGG